MKKLLLTIGLVCATISSFAQPKHYSDSFLIPGITAVYVTNTFGITNLFTTAAEGTNQVGTAYTNSGTLVIAAAANYQPLLNDVQMIPPPGGRNFSLYTNDSFGKLFADVPANVSVTYSSGSGANAAVTFVMVPMIDDDTEVNANPWTWSFTAAASQTGATISTNAEFLWQWAGAKKIRVRRITNADTDATSHVIITGLQFNHWK